jgi:2-oxoglutarate ferredoxin oxidoreductase subunit alpha
MEHVLGGLEKNEDGAISYEPENHQKMVELRQAKVDKVADFIPPLETEFAPEGDLLIVGWGGTYGTLKAAAQELTDKGYRVGLAHFNYINPLPKGVKDVFSRYRKIVVAELNMGQFANYLRMKHPEFRYEQYNKVQGLPFMASELTEAFEKLLKD